MSDSTTHPVGQAAFPAWNQFLYMIAPAFLVMVLPAIYNGFPLVFWDSGMYLSIAITLHKGTWWNVSPFYSFFMLPLHWKVSLWPVVVAQASLTVAIVSIFLRASLQIVPIRQLSFLLCVFTATTSIAIVACELMPDVFTPIAILCTCTLIFYRDRLSLLELRFVSALLLLSICVHQANFLIALLTVLSAYAINSIAQRHLVNWRAYTRSLVLIGCGLLLLMAPNILFFGKPVVTRGGSVYLLAKLIDDGVGLDYLNKECSREQYSLCAQLANIIEYRDHASQDQMRVQPVSDFVLWGPPMNYAHNWAAVADYASRVDLAAIREEPGRFVWESAHNAWRQLTTFRTGDALVPYPEKAFVSETIRTFFPVRTSRAFQSSRQERGLLRLETVSQFHVAVVIMSFLVIILLLVTRVANPQQVSVVCTLLAAVAANAAVTGALSAVHDRYQSRVACLVPLGAMLLTYGWLAERQRSLSSQRRSAGT